MNIVFGSLASREYEEAFNYYEAEEPGFGEKFRRAVWGAIGIIEQYPHSCAEVRPGVRKVLLRRFPFKLLYAVGGDTLYIIAVAHGHRKPDYWVERL